MTPGSKILTGVLGTAALSLILHGPAGFGKGLVDQLGNQAQQVAAEGNGVKVAMAGTGADGSYYRGAILSGGSSNAEERDALLAKVQAIPGMSWARWEDNKIAAPKIDDDATPASIEEVKDCQADVNAAIAGKTIQFDSGAASIKPESTALIEDLAKRIAACGGTKVEVAGHTDLTGNAASNMALSESRAASVVAAMTAKGVPADRLEAKGYGVTKPLDPAMTPEAHAKNRRIEFAVAAAPAK